MYRASSALALHNLHNLHNLHKFRPTRSQPLTVRRRQSYARPASWLSFPKGRPLPKDQLPDEGIVIISVEQRTNLLRKKLHV